MSDTPGPLQRDDPPKLRKIWRRSQWSGKEHSMEIPMTDAQYDEYLSGSGRYVQHIFPDLTPDQREFLITGVTVDEWDQMFPPGSENEI